MGMHGYLRDTKQPPCICIIIFFACYIYCCMYCNLSSSAGAEFTCGHVYMLDHVSDIKGQGSIALLCNIGLQSLVARPLSPRPMMSVYFDLPPPGGTHPIYCTGSIRSGAPICGFVNSALHKHDIMFCLICSLPLGKLRMQYSVMLRTQYT